MIVAKRISTRRVLKIIWPQLLGLITLSTLTVAPVVYFGWQKYMIGPTAPLIWGTAISIFLGFRTNSSYMRWMTAKQLWSSVLNSGRNLGLALARINEDYVEHKTGKISKTAETVMTRMLNRAMAWAWCLDRQLKDLPPLDELDRFLDAEELDMLKKSHNPALEMLFSQRRDFREVARQGQFMDGEHFEVVGIIRDMLNSQTRCEGIKSTPFPRHYTYFTRVFIWVFVFLISLALTKLESIGYFAIPLAVLVGWIFKMVEGIATYMDDPFTNNRNVIPMDSSSTKLEIDLRRIAFGETEGVPDPLQPVDGALY